MRSLQCKAIYEQFGRGEFTAAQAGLSYEIMHYKRLMYVYRVRVDRCQTGNKPLQTWWKLTERGIRRAKKEMKEDEK